MRKRKRTTVKKRPSKTRTKKTSKKSFKLPSNAKMLTYIASAPLPPRFMTLFTYANTGIMPANTTNADKWVCKMNDPVFPFIKNGTFGYSGFYGPVKALNTLEPSGLAALMNTSMYKYFRVNWSSISVRFIPQDTGDSVAVCIIPFNSLTTLPATLTYDWAEQQQGAVTKIFTNSNCTQWLSNKGTVSYVTGVDPKAIEYDLSNQYNGSFAASPVALCYWYVFYKTFSAVQNIAQIGIECKGNYLTELWNFANMNMPET